MFSSPISRYLHDLRQRLLPNTQGEVATYIPELSHADPMSFGIAIATMDGNIYDAGETATEFTIQSMSKPFTYGQALQRLGTEAVLARVGVEPTGEAFNSIVLDETNNRPFNPMVNAGAIAIANLLCGPDGEADMLSLFSRLAGRSLAVDQSVFRSELATGHRNRAIAHMMLNTGMIDHPPNDVLDLYFRQCSVNVTGRDMAIMAAGLANLGKNPVTGDQIFAPEHVRDVLTLMNTCGMYDYAGQWAYEVGIAAKSGVSGGIIAVIPGQAGIAVWSPPLDGHGNSVRGVEVCKAISREFGLHAFGEKPNAGTVIRRHHRASDVGSKRMRSESEQAWLADRATRISITELQGALYFGSAEMVIRRLAATAPEVDEIVVDFRRVSYADAAAARLLTQSFDELRGLGRRVTLSGLGSESPLTAFSRHIASTYEWIEIATDLDSAVQAAEDRLLANHYESRDTAKYALASMDILKGLSAEDYRHLEGIVATMSYSRGQKIVAEGEPANAFFIIASGSASVTIRLEDGRRRRLASIGPGSALGEMALVEGGRRTADVHADETVFAYVFALERIFDLSAKRPRILETILSNIVLGMSQKLRQANEEIRNLE